MTKIWRYALRHDNGMAPCIDDGLMTLACCKPLIRRSAVCGDWVIGFVSKSVGKSATTIAWVGKVGRSLRLGDYQGEFPDRRDAIYRRVSYRSDGSEELIRVLQNDYHRGVEGRDWTGRNALIFDRFWYWGNNSQISAPETIVDLAHPYVGQTKRGSSAEKVRDLENWLMHIGTAGVFGLPRDPRPF